MKKVSKEVPIMRIHLSVTQCHKHLLIAAYVADHCPLFHYPTLWEEDKSQPDQKEHVHSI